jgi:hypothetical protein
MNGWITPGMLDAIVAGVALEFVGLAALLVHARSPRLIVPLLLYLASGAFLLLALRASLAGAATAWIALALLASLVVHVASLVRTHRIFFGEASPAPDRHAGRRVA